MKFSEARKFADSLANGGEGFSEVDGFDMFNIDLSKQSHKGVCTPSMLRTAKSCGVGASWLWGFRPIQRTAGVVDFAAITAEERKRFQKREQAARAEQLAELAAKIPKRILHDEETDMEGLAERLPRPNWL